jgi:hypothetical protein
MLPRHELVGRLAGTMRERIAPTVADEYQRTQAFMVAVILDKVARELALADDHERAERLDLESLHSDLAATLSGDLPPAVADAWGSARQAATYHSLTPLIDALHAGRDAMGTERVDAALTRIRAYLRRHLDRAMEVAAS